MKILRRVIRRAVQTSEQTLSLFMNSTQIWLIRKPLICVTIHFSFAWKHPGCWWTARNWWWTTDISSLSGSAPDKTECSWTSRQCSPHPTVSAQSWNTARDNHPVSPEEYVPCVGLPDILLPSATSQTDSRLSSHAVLLNSTSVQSWTFLAHWLLLVLFSGAWLLF